MTLREFYDRLISIKYHSMPHITDSIGVKAARKFFKNIPDLTYSDAKVMYDFLKFYRWDFNGAYIVIHYPELVIEGKHTIRDLYFAFNPIYIKLFPLKAARSTYSLAEIDCKYLHSHISADTMLESFTRSICFGSTVYRDSGDVCNDFINFLLYLDTYLRHEETYNPYNKIENLYKDVNNDFDITLTIPLDIFDYKIGMVNKVKMLIPQYTEEADKFFTKHLGNAIKVNSFNGKETFINESSIRRAKSHEGFNLYENLDTYTKLSPKRKYFEFQNELVTIKIIDNELSETKTSEKFKQYICEKLTGEATYRFMETYSEFEYESAESFEVHLQQD
jgi:7,8-dihydro-6-hydroxymethylpterin-pyrophosphokinase